MQRRGVLAGSMKMEAASHIDPQRLSSSNSYAVVVKTYVWNAFVARQVGRIAAMVRSGDVWVMVDETRGPVQGITHSHVLRVTEADAIRLGLADAKTGRSLFWYCADYLHHLFLEAHPDYTHYVFVEHDVAARIDFDAFIDSLMENAVDYVGTPMRTAAAADPWLAEHLSVYKPRELKRDLYCFAAFSERAMRILQSRRLAMSRDFTSGSLSFWPIGEVFVPSEIDRAGLRKRDLGNYGDTSHYDWWPPSHEDDLPTLAAPSFAHPVLEGVSYLQSALRHARFADLLRRGSPAQKRIMRYGASTCLPHFLREVGRRGTASVRRRLERFGVVPRWTAGIEARAPDPLRTVQ